MTTLMTTHWTWKSIASKENKWRSSWSSLRNDLRRHSVVWTHSATRLRLSSHQVTNFSYQVTSSDAKDKLDARKMGKLTSTTWWVEFLKFWYNFWLDFNNIEALRLLQVPGKSQSRLQVAHDQRRQRTLPLPSSASTRMHLLRWRWRLGSHSWRMSNHLWGRLRLLASLKLITEQSAASLELHAKLNLLCIITRVGVFMGYSQDY